MTEYRLDDLEAFDPLLEDQVSEDDWAAAMVAQSEIESKDSFDEKAFIKQELGKFMETVEKQVTDNGNQSFSIEFDENEFIRQNLKEIMRKLEKQSENEIPNLNKKLLGIPIKLTAVIGSKTLSVQELQNLQTGVVLEFDESFDSYVEIRANGQPIALGELVTINGVLGVRLISNKEKD